MNKIPKCPLCGILGHTTTKSKHCLQNSGRKLQRLYTYMLIFIITLSILIVVLWFVKQPIVDTNIQNNDGPYKTSHEITHENIDNSSAASMVSSTAFVENLHSAYMKQINRSRMSVDITYIFGLIAIFLLFKFYISELIVLRDEVYQLKAAVLQDRIVDNQQGIICDSTPSMNTITT
jgi:hypothetical protein